MGRGVRDAIANEWMQMDGDWQHICLCLCVGRSLRNYSLIQWAHFRVGTVASSLSVKNGTRYSHTISRLVPLQKQQDTLPPVGSVARISSNESSHSSESIIVQCRTDRSTMEPYNNM